MLTVTLTLCALLLSAAVQVQHPSFCTSCQVRGALQFMTPPDVYIHEFMCPGPSAATRQQQYTKDQLLSLTRTRSGQQHELSLDVISSLQDHELYRPKKNRRLHHRTQTWRPCLHTSLVAGDKNIPVITTLVRNKLPNSRQQPRDLISVRKIQFPRHRSKCNLLKTGSVNVRSVRNKLDEIINIVIEEDFDIFSLTEIWLTSLDKDQFYIKAFDLQGYKSKFYPREDYSGHGGIAVLYKTSLTLLSSAQFDSSQIENCTLTFGTNSRRFDYTTVYRPPVSDKNRLFKSKFIDDFSDILHQYDTVTSPLLVVGDFNIHVDNPQDPSLRNFSDLLASLNFHQHVNVPTHQSGHTLDLVISRNGDSLVLDVQVKHHNLILTSLKLKRERNTIKEISQEMEED